MRYSRRMLFEPSRVRAITIDLDDTLWPIWPTIARAEAVLHAWLADRAPATAAKYATPQALRELRQAMAIERPDLVHDLGAMRLESIRLALTRAGDDPALAEPAFDVFFDERQRVELYEDALPALEFLVQRYPVVALTNGNSDLARVGLTHFFRHTFSASAFGIAKPDARIFHAAAAAAGVAPSEVLHVGDDPLLDVVGAIEAGMQAYWLSRESVAWAHGHRGQPHVVADGLHRLAEILA
jgi:putative hydrolase of the HAD superfamily